ncbi:MAG: outer membrane beta-barrel protein [Betaproteobacteria bacterium]|nr:outer membrane beta-barrel protein [Betaproteobacteria bacterium]
MTKHTPILAAAALAALLASGQAAAQNSGWYMGGGPGSAKAAFTRGDFTSLGSGTYSVDDSDVAPRVFGGYRIAPNWGVEFGVASLGRYKHRFTSGSNYAVYHYDASAATVAMAANLPVAGGVSMNGRLGVAFTAAQLRLASNNGLATPRTCITVFFDDCTSTSTNLYWGLGAQFDIDPRWGIRLDYDNYGEVGDEFETGRAKIETWSANVLFRF